MDSVITAEMHRAWISFHLAVQFLHRDEIEGLQGMSVGGDEIQADVDPRVVVVKQGALYF